MATRPKGFVPDYHGVNPPRDHPLPPQPRATTDAVANPSFGATANRRPNYTPPTPRQMMDRRMATPPVYTGDKPELPDFDPSVDTFIGVSKDLSSIERNRALVPGLKQGSRK